MKRQFIFGTILSAAFAVSLAAQQPPASQPPAGQTPPATTGAPTSADRQQAGERPQAGRTGQTLTLTGCVAAAGSGASAAGAPAAGQAAQSAGSYILTNVSPAESMATSTPAGTTGTAMAVRLGRPVPRARRPRRGIA
jgi:hypothetical protein